MESIFEMLGKWRNILVLKYFLDNPSVSIYPANLIKQLKISKKSLFDALSELEANGIINKKSIGKTMLYSLEKEKALVKQLKSLLSLSKLDHLKKNFENHECEVYLFGSTARGEDNEKSDIDLLVITNEEKEVIAGLLAKIRIKNLKPVIFTPMDYVHLYKADRAFYERIEKDRIRLV
jgi:predicted nucleotidyltransferase